MFVSRSMRSNLVVFLADLFNLLEIHPAQCVRFDRAAVPLTEGKLLLLLTIPLSLCPNQPTNQCILYLKPIFPVWFLYLAWFCLVIFFNDMNVWIFLLEIMELPDSWEVSKTKYVKNINLKLKLPSGENVPWEFFLTLELNRTPNI